MKKYIYKSTITVMLCLLFFMQKDILADNTTLCASTSVYQDIVLKSPQVPQYGTLRLQFSDSDPNKPKGRIDFVCHYSYDSRSCESKPKGGCFLTLSTDKSSSNKCPSSFANTVTGANWLTFDVKDLLDLAPSITKNATIISVIWTPEKQPELSTMLVYDPAPTNTMPLIHLMVNPRIGQQVYIEDTTVPTSGDCQYLCIADQCKQNICSSTQSFDTSTIMGVLIAPQETSGYSCDYSFKDNGFTPAPGAGAGSISQCSNSSQPKAKSDEPMHAAMFKTTAYNQLQVYDSPTYNEHLMALSLRMGTKAGTKTTPVMILTKPTKLIKDNRNILFAVPEAYNLKLPLDKWCTDSLQ